MNRKVKTQPNTSEGSCNKITAIDVFAGAGGLTQGLKQAGVQVIGAIELDSLASETYLLNHPDVIMWNKDIQTVKGREILKRLNIKKGDLDILAGCPPCQGFSSLRTRNGSISIKDDRNDLVFEFLRLVEELQPKTVMMENVPELAKDMRIPWIIDMLCRMGYKVGDKVYHIRDARDFGVPQRRRRFILMASRFGKIDFPEKLSVKPNLRDFLNPEAYEGLDDDPLHNYKIKRSEKIEKLIAAIPQDGGSRSALPVEQQLACHQKITRGFDDVYGRMSWSAPSPTITCGCIDPSKGRFLHPSENRAITLREAAILQTFPKDYKFSLRSGRRKVGILIGNALPPKLVEHHARKMISHILSAPKSQT